MSRLVIEKPAEVRLEGLTPAQLDLARTFLTYDDSGVRYMLQQHKKKRYWKASNPETWQARLDELKDSLKARILFERDGYDPVTYSGLAQDLSEQLGGVPVENLIQYPKMPGVAWDTVPKHPPRPYQTEMEQALIEAKHAAVEVGTGLGKSRSIMDICHDIGLRAVVMAPSTSIAWQLHREFTKHFGRQRVGMYGDGKKEVGKLFTIGIGASLTRVEPGTPAWEWFSGAEVFIADESHQTPAKTLEKVCMQLMARATYRFFFSATQVRMDGSEAVLKGITGPVVYHKSVREGVEEGWLARPQFKMFKVRSDSSYESDDVQRMVRAHLYENPRVLDLAADIANKSVKLLGHQVVILVDELNQFNLLAPRLKYEFRFAHGQDNSKEAKKVLPKEYWRSDPVALVDAFNERQYPILIGTSCISTGTDIQNVETCCYLMGGKSEIQVPQAVGRCTRRGDRADGQRKCDCNFVDFAPQLRTDSYDDIDKDGNMSPVFRHAIARAAIYKDIYPSLQWLQG